MKFWCSLKIVHPTSKLCTTPRVQNEAFSSNTEIYIYVFSLLEVALGSKILETTLLLKKIIILDE